MTKFLIKAGSFLMVAICLNTFGGWLLGFPKVGAWHILAALCSFNFAGVLLWSMWDCE